MEFINKITSFFRPGTGTNPESAYSSSATPVEIAGDAKSSAMSSWSEQNENLYLQLEDKYYHYFIGVNGLLDIDLSPLESNAIKSLEKILQQDQALAKDIPRLPSIVPKLLHLLKTDDFNWKEVAHVIASDPVILVEIINVARSSAYNLKVKDVQLEHIIAKIGLLEVRVAILKGALKPIMSFKNRHFLKHSDTKIWAHAVNTATACRTLAEIYKHDPFEAYLAGILSNIGMVIIVKRLHEIKEFTVAPISSQFKDILLKLAKQLSIKIADNWEMHPNIVLALTEQYDSHTKKIESGLGDILYEATTVSMEHILVNKKLWLKEEHTDNKKTYKPFDMAYKELDSLNS